MVEQTSKWYVSVNYRLIGPENLNEIKNAEQDSQGIVAIFDVAGRTLNVFTAKGSVSVDTMSVRIGTRQLEQSTLVQVGARVTVGRQLVTGRTFTSIRSANVDAVMDAQGRTLIVCSCTQRTFVEIVASQSIRGQSEAGVAQTNVRSRYVQATVLTSMIAFTALVDIVANERVGRAGQRKRPLTISRLAITVERARSVDTTSVRCAPTSRG
jgi:hypothetical protein